MPSWCRECTSWGSRGIQTVTSGSATGLWVAGFEAYQSVLFPVYCLVLVRVGVGEAFDLAGFTPEEAVEIGSDFVALAFA